MDFSHIELAVMINHFVLKLISHTEVEHPKISGIIVPSLFFRS